MWEAPPAMCSLLWQDSNVMSSHAFSEQGLLDFRLILSTSIKINASL